MIVGITGGIGSGKSLLSRILIELGYSVFNSDLEAKNILQNDTEVRELIVAKFGGDSFLDGIPNRKFIAQKIFSDKENMSFLNGLIHPRLQLVFDKWIDIESKKVNGHILFKEAAILIETKGYEKLDKLILVTAPEAIRIDRVMKRDGSSKEEILSRIRNQMPDSEKIKFADYLVDNAGDNSVLKQVLVILNKLNETAKR